MTTLARNSAEAAPSLPFLTDQYGPTNDDLWQKVLEVAKGRRREFTLNGRTIHSPNNGKGFHPWPNPYGTAWAIKQYKGFSGGWKRKESSGMQVLARARLGPAATLQGTEEHALAGRLSEQGLLRLGRVQGAWHYWTATFEGARLIRAGLGDDLQHRMNDLLQDFDAGKAKDLGEWLDVNFRVNSPKTPKGGKELKDRLQRLVWVLRYRASQSVGDPADVAKKVRAEVESDWRLIEPQLPQLVAGFTDEGGKVVPKSITIGSATYVNEVGVDAASVEKYATRLDAIFRSITGWRSKAMKGGLKVVLASPRNFRGTAAGNYRQSEDALYVRATPNILKRGAGYASFEYVIVHELGHRYERLNSLPEDFDKPQWWTTRYSRTEGLGGSEGFAELFALGHFDLKGSWDPGIIERFEQVMTGQGA